MKLADAKKNFSRSFQGDPFGGSGCDRLESRQGRRKKGQSTAASGKLSQVRRKNSLPKRKGGHEWADKSDTAHRKQVHIDDTWHGQWNCGDESTRVSSCPVNSLLQRSSYSTSLQRGQKSIFGPHVRSSERAVRISRRLCVYIQQVVRYQGRGRRWRLALLHQLQRNSKGAPNALKGFEFSVGETITSKAYHIMTPGETSGKIVKCECSRCFTRVPQWIRRRYFNQLCGNVCKA